MIAARAIGFRMFGVLQFDRFIECDVGIAHREPVERVVGDRRLRGRQQIRRIVEMLGEKLAALSGRIVNRGG